jgi:hypothetical protein
MRSPLVIEKMAIKNRRCFLGVRNFVPFWGVAVPKVQRLLYDHGLRIAPISL